MPPFLPGTNRYPIYSEAERRASALGKRRRRAVSDPMPMDIDNEEGGQSRCSLCNGVIGSSPNTSPIYFYSSGKPFYEFTNFSPHSVEYDGKIYATAEHLFQAFKFMIAAPALAERIRIQPSARAARSEAGFQRTHQRLDWFVVNIDAMDIVLKAKFMQHEDLRLKLLETGNRELIEDSPDDVFWGIGKDGQGRNELGKALMRLRERLRESLRGSPGSQLPSASTRPPVPVSGQNVVISPL